VTPPQAGTPRFAAIDIGTNSVLLLVAEAQGGRLVPVWDQAVITRLGRGVDAARRLDPDAVRRTLDCLGAYAKELERAEAQSLAVVGTSALRDAEGSEAFLAQAERLLGTRPRILSGPEEAELSFRGAVSGLHFVGSATVFDVGGGSTEIIAGNVDVGSALVKCKESIDIGAVRLHERYVRRDPISLEELVALRKEIRRCLPDVKPYRNSTVIGVAGTVTTLFAMARQLEPYDGARVHGATLSRSEVEHWLFALQQRNLDERRLIPGLEPRRADVILAGAAIVLEIFDWLELDSISVSDRGLRWGLVEKAAALASTDR